MIRKYCPECDGPLTKKGIFSHTIDKYLESWMECIDCGWDDKNDS